MDVGLLRPGHTNFRTPLRQPMRQVSPTLVELEGRVFTFFGGTNYLGLSFHPSVIEALKSGVDAYGFGLGASRNTTGSSPELEELETLAAVFCGTESSIATTSGMLANITVLEGLSGFVDAWLVDEASHPSFQRFSTISGEPLFQYRHCDVDDLYQQLRRIGKTRVGIFTDSIFPLTGNVAPLRAIAAKLAGDDHLLVIDEAHAIGVLGKNGRGLSHELHLTGQKVVITATMSKALGCIGGLISGSREILDRIREKSSAYSATSALPPALCRAAAAAFTILLEEPDRLRRLQENCSAMNKHLQNVPLEARNSSVPIFCLKGRHGIDLKAIHLCCRDRSLYVPLITSYPGAGSGGILRWIVQSEHRPDQISDLCTILKSQLEI